MGGYNDRRQYRRTTNRGSWGLSTPPLAVVRRELWPCSHQVWTCWYRKARRRWEAVVLLLLPSRVCDMLIVIEKEVRVGYARKAKPGEDRRSTIVDTGLDQTLWRWGNSRVVCLFTHHSSAVEPFPLPRSLNSSLVKATEIRSLLEHNT